ncbi:MAG: aspartate/glutamate racemase family protein [Syntrophobacteraceae bacterium]
MSEKAIGVLGGMGPEATLNFFRELIANTPARTDQEHLRVIIDSNPKIPDRTNAILHGGESPVPAMAAGCMALERAGADFIVIPCVTAHLFLEELRERVTLPLLSIFDATAEYIERCHPGVRKVGLLATTGTIQGGLFQKRLIRCGVETLTPDSEDQLRVMSAIYDIKDANARRTREEISEEARAIACKLIDCGAEGITAGCTEIPLVLKAGDVAVPVFDPITILAKAAIAFARD